MTLYKSPLMVNLSIGRMTWFVTKLIPGYSSVGKGIRYSCAPFSW